jgi:hypothetical protein
VTCPSPAITTLPSRRTQITVVDRMRCFIEITILSQWRGRRSRAVYHDGMQILRASVLFLLWSIVGLFAQAQAPPPANKMPLPADLIGTLRQDLKVGDKQQCLEDKHLRLDQAISTEWLNLNSTAGPVLLVRGVAPCLGSVDNGPIVLYGQFSEGWRRMLFDTGHQVMPLHSGTRGWADLEVWEQQSPSESIRRGYRFDGFAYKAGSCHQVQVADPATVQPLAKPISKPCQR